MNIPDSIAGSLEWARLLFGFRGSGRHRARPRHAKTVRAAMAMGPVSSLPSVPTPTVVPVPSGKDEAALVRPYFTAYERQVERQRPRPSRRTVLVVSRLDWAVSR